MIEPVDVPGWNTKFSFSPAVRAGDYIFTSGLTAVDENGMVVHKGDIVAQARAVYRRIEGILARAGAGLDSIVETTEFFVPDPLYKGTAELRRELFGDRFPAATGIPVQSLIRKDALIEIKAVAYVPRERLPR
jgi:enamine deaminase RidA (YjgF/YER057c/UK114 family)